ncbi:MAG: GIY-YIG nuclease family protein [Ardenticatenia bacterium]|nr:GIY-YIG nuclease family protein [Ardenticatenia bacterium]
MVCCPPKPGTYVVAFRLQAERALTVGRLGTFVFEPGLYVYVGSAFGPGGLRARVGRHWHGARTPRWHVDYLRRTVPVAWAAWTTGKRLECCWSQALAADMAFCVPVPGFGASDCRSGCHAHLLVGALETSPADVLVPLVALGRGAITLMMASAAGGDAHHGAGGEPNG